MELTIHSINTPCIKNLFHSKIVLSSYTRFDIRVPLSSKWRKIVRARRGIDNGVATTIHSTINTPCIWEKFIRFENCVLSCFVYGNAAS